MFPVLQNAHDSHLTVYKDLMLIKISHKQKSQQEFFVLLKSTGVLSWMEWAAVTLFNNPTEKISTRHICYGKYFWSIFACKWGAPYMKYMRAVCTLKEKLMLMKKYTPVYVGLDTVVNMSTYTLYMTKSQSYTCILYSLISLQWPIGFSLSYSHLHSTFSKYYLHLM